MYNSFAIWHKKRLQTVEPSSAELHFNLWQFSSKKNGFQDFIDIGIKIEEIGAFESVKLFVPFLLNENDVRDLGRTIAKSQKLLTAIFNEFSTVGNENAKLIEVTLRTESEQSSSELFKIYIIDGNNIELEHCEEGEGNRKVGVGTVISIDVSNIKNCDSIPVYLRIRIKFPSQEILGKILHQHVPKDSWLQSSTEKKEFVDFRLNEKRNLPKTIQELCVDNFLKIKKIHFFLMREFADEPIMSDPLNSAYRVLESDTWSEYACEGANIQIDHMIAYHWKSSPSEKSHISSFTLSAKFGFQESSNWKIFIVIFMSLFLGAVGGVFGNFATKIIEGGENGIEKIEQSR